MPNQNKGEHKKMQIEINIMKNYHGIFSIKLIGADQKNINS